MSMPARCAAGVLGDRLAVDDLRHGPADGTSFTASLANWNTQ
jgi:hypothetical protein